MSCKHWGRRKRRAGKKEREPRMASCSFVKVLESRGERVWNSERKGEGEVSGGACLDGSVESTGGRMGRWAEEDVGDGMK